jgi:hypothetical protein
MHGVVLDDDYQQVRIQQQFSIRISPAPGAAAGFCDGE